MWLHLRSDRFPQRRGSKLAPRGDGPFRVLEKINDNAYRLELPGEYTVSHTFNVADLEIFHVGDTEAMGTAPFQEGENDEDIELVTAPKPVAHGPENVPFIPDRPMTRSRSRFLHNKFNTFVDKLLDIMYPDSNEVTKPELQAQTESPSKREDSRPTDNEDQPQLNNSKENHQAESKTYQDPPFLSYHEPWPMIITRTGYTITTITSP